MQPLPPNAGLALEAIGISLWKSLARLRGSQLLSLQLAQLSLDQSAVGSAIRHQIGTLDPTTLNTFLSDWRRASLLTATGIFDSFLSDSLRYYFLANPAAITTALSGKAANNLTQKTSSPEQRAETIVRKHLRSWHRRLDFLTTELSATIPDSDYSEMKRLILVRNEVAHHNGLYDFAVDQKDSHVYANPRPTPEVTKRDSMLASMLVTEITDCILVAMFNKLLGTQPRVRLLTEDVATVHSELRRSWAAEDSAETAVEQVNEPQWSVLSSSSPTRVEEVTGNIWVIPTGIEPVPALFSVLRNKKHGMDARVWVDDSEPMALSDSKALLQAMLDGQELSVEFFEERKDGPSMARYSLAGFRNAWDQAKEAAMRAESS